MNIPAAAPGPQYGNCAVLRGRRWKERGVV